jgi:hypothetical protein
MLRIIAQSKAPEYSFICQVLPSAKPLLPGFLLSGNRAEMIKQSGSLWALETSENGSVCRERIQQLNAQNLRG